LPPDQPSATGRSTPSTRPRAEGRDPLDANRDPILIPGLWGIGFGGSLQNQPTNTLFFAAGPDDENHGLYGRIDQNPGG
jgi:hypothetical protein